jgi:hypothetical protein
MAFDGLDQVCDQLWGEQGGRTAAEENRVYRDFLAAGGAFATVRDLLNQSSDIWLDQVFETGVGIKIAVPAALLTERDVEINTVWFHRVEYIIIELLYLVKAGIISVVYEYRSKFLNENMPNLRHAGE